MSVWYMIKGEQRNFLMGPSMVIDTDLEIEEAQKMILELKSEMPLWHFWMEEQEFIDEIVPQSVRT